MEVKLDKQYPLDVDATRSWTLLTDLKAVASCMPGAQITEQLSETSYKGAVKVKVGPAVAQFGGTVDVLELDPTLKRMVMFGKGADKTGSSASMNMTVTIVADPSDPTHSVLNGQAVVIVNGKFAQFGGRLMVQVSDMLLAQFVENFRQQAKTLPGAAGAAQVSGAAKTASRPEPAQVASEINGLAIAWMLVKNWISGMFGKRS